MASRRFDVSIAVGALCWGALVAAVPSVAGAAPKHVILVSIDTLRADHVGVYGSDVQTPHIDAFAKDSVRFEHAYTASTMTLPSHITMFTGLFPHNHGVPWNGAVVPKENELLAEVLQAAGYSTAAFIGGNPMGKSTGIDQGFQTYPGVIEDPSERLRRSLEWIDTHKAQPMFLFVHLWEAHWPYHPPAPYDRMYRTDSSDISGTFDEIVKLRKDYKTKVPGSQERSDIMKTLYMGGVSHADSVFGELMAGLAARNVLDDSIVVLVSDHGESTDEHFDVWTHGATAYNTNAQVPLIVRLPGKERQGAVVPDRVSLIDLMPTVLEEVGQPVPTGLDGTSLSAALHGRGTIPDRTLYVEAPLSRNDPDPSMKWINEKKCAAVIVGDLKLHRCPQWKKLELYALDKDPEEKTNLAKKPEMRDAMTELQGSLDRWRAGGATKQLEVDTDKDTINALKELGYME